MLKAKRKKCTNAIAKDYCDKYALEYQKPVIMETLKNEWMVVSFINDIMIHIDDCPFRRGSFIIKEFI